MSDEPFERPALVHAYLECPNCGRIPKPAGVLFVRQGVQGMDSPDHVHCRLRCDRCGSDEAMLYAQLEMMPSH